MSTSPPPVDPNAPIHDFSQCHAGIVKRLDLLGELPALLAPAARAREIAEQSLEFFREAIYEHHLDEERELFPAVQASAQPGDEADRVKAIAKQLTDEHRALEATWKRLESGLKKVAKGHDTDLDVAEIQRLVTQYRAHANFEETEYLPLAQSILSRNQHHMEALGLSLHLRHMPMPIKGYL
jgi:hemerythrin-like domain-containing protein